MEKFDNDSDGLLDMDEFKSLMNKNQKKKEVWFDIMKILLLSIRL